MVLVFLANGFEEIEALTPVDCLRRCEIDVRTVGVENRVVTGSHGIKLVADIDDFEVLPDNNLEMIILPGGMPGTLNLEKSETVQKTIDYCAANGIPIAAICAAPSILGHLGLLKGINATCYTGFEDQLIGANVLKDSACVSDGNFITACGPGAALEFSCEIIKRLLGEERVNLLLKALNKK